LSNVRATHVTKFDSLKLTEGKFDISLYVMLAYTQSAWSSKDYSIHYKAFNTWYCNRRLTSQDGHS